MKQNYENELTEDELKNTVIVTVEKDPNCDYILKIVGIIGSLRVDKETTPERPDDIMLLRECLEKQIDIQSIPDNRKLKVALEGGLEWFGIDKVRRCYNVYRSWLV